MDSIEWLPFSDFGLTAGHDDDFIFDFDFTVKNIYEEASGKYGV